MLADELDMLLDALVDEGSRPRYWESSIRDMVERVSASERECADLAAKLEAAEQAQSAYRKQNRSMTARLEMIYRIIEGGHLHLALVRELRRFCPPYETAEQIVSASPVVLADWLHAKIIEEIKKGDNLNIPHPFSVHERKLKDENRKLVQERGELRAQVAQLTAEVARLREALEVYARSPVGWIARQALVPDPAAALVKRLTPEVIDYNDDHDDKQSVVYEDDV